MRQKCKINLVEDFVSLSIDVNALHYARAFGERTVTFPSIKSHHHWLCGLSTDRYSVSSNSSPAGNGTPFCCSGVGSPGALGGRTSCAHSAA